MVTATAARQSQTLDTGPRRFSELLETCTKSAGLLGIMGYMSFRAHVNVLGLSAATAPSVPRLLMETYQLVMAAFPFVTLASAIVGIGALLYRFKPKRLALPHLHRRASVILVIASLLLALIGLGQIAQTKFDIAVGKLDASHLVPTRTVPTFELFCVVGVLAATLKLFDTFEGAGSRLFRVFGLALTGFCLFEIPILFGAHNHPQNYPLVHVVSEGSSYCGLLVYRTDSDLLLWTASNGVGFTVGLPADKVARIEMGRTLEVLSVAKQALSTMSRQPTCEEFGGK